jgi:hypothetical protein
MCLWWRKYTPVTSRCADASARTKSDGHTLPIVFVMVVLHERGMDHPEVRYSVMTATSKAGRTCRGGPNMQRRAEHAERRMDQPEVRYSVMTSMARAVGRDDWPRTVEQTPTHVADAALIGGLPWAGQGRTGAGSSGQLYELSRKGERCQARRFAGLQGSGAQGGSAGRERTDPQVGTGWEDSWVSKIFFAGLSLLAPNDNEGGDVREWSA